MPRRSARGRAKRRWSTFHDPFPRPKEHPSISLTYDRYQASRPRSARRWVVGLRGPIRSVETTRVSLATKAAVARLIGTDGTQEVNLAQCRPQHIRKVELTVHALPKQKT